MSESIVVSQRTTLKNTTQFKIPISYLDQYDDDAEELQDYLESLVEADKEPDDVITYIEDGYVYVEFDHEQLIEYPKVPLPQKEETENDG